MRKYFTIAPSKESDEYYCEPPAIIDNLTVYEPEYKADFSGLYDHDGKPLYATNRAPIGFIYHNE